MCLSWWRAYDLCVRRIFLTVEHQMERREDTETQGPVGRLWWPRGQWVMRTWSGGGRGTERRSWLSAPSGSNETVMATFTADRAADFAHNCSWLPHLAVTSQGIGHSSHLPVWLGVGQGHKSDHVLHLTPGSKYVCYHFKNKEAQGKCCIKIKNTL